MKHTVLAAPLLVCFALSPAQPKVSMQAYGQYGAEDKDNLYKTAGIEGFVESENFFYAGSLMYLDATINSFNTSSTPKVYSGISVLENMSGSTLSTTKRFTWGNRLEYFHPSGFNAAVTGGFAYETADFRSTYTYAYDPRPLPVGWDTTFRYSDRLVTRYLITGLELSRFVDWQKFGTGFLYVADFHDVKRIQPYLFFVSNVFRRIVVKTTAGAVVHDGELDPHAKAIVSWRPAVDIELRGSILYSRTTFLYDVFDRFLSYYREKNELQGGLLALFGLSPHVDLFTGVKYETNDRFDMWVITLGTYIHP